MPPRQKKSWIGTSWKMHKMLNEATAYAQALSEAQVSSQIQPFVIPPFTSLRDVSSLLTNSRVLV